MTLKLKLDSANFEALFGNRDKNLHALEGLLDVKITSQGDTLQIGGSPAQSQIGAQILKTFSELIRDGFKPGVEEVRTAVRLIEENGGKDIAEYFTDFYLKISASRQVHPRSYNQRAYLQAMAKFDLVFGLGPAGTGKTYLAVAQAVADLRLERIRRLVLVRPAIEAGEKLGYLPGDMQAKIDPYLRPLYDALFDLLPNERVERYMERGIIEIAPLAFMRGRTLNDAFVILDEGQNTTADQMKMFLTRIGNGSKAVITGDLTQIDLPKGRVSGITDALQVLSQIREISIIQFTRRDVIRHRLVEKIVHAYEIRDKKVRDDDSTDS